jgi:hypothetical protein
MRRVSVLSTPDSFTTPQCSTYRPADIVGHVPSLQIGIPVTPFTS